MRYHANTPNITCRTSDLITLSTQDMKQVGRFWIEDNILMFEGNAAESAKVFFHELFLKNESYVKSVRDSIMENLINDSTNPV